MNIDELKKRCSKILEKQKNIVDMADNENRNLSQEEELEYDALDAEFDNLQTKIKGILRNYGTGPVVGLQTAQNKTIKINSKRSIEVDPMKNKDNYKYNENGTELRDAFNRYLQHGPNALSPQEFRALQADADTAGGFLVTPTQVANSVIQELNNAVFIRKLAKKFQVPNAESLGCPAIDTEMGDPTWTTELATGNEDTDLDFQRRDLTPHPVARRIKVSNKLLRAAALNPEQIVQQQMIYKIGVVHENAFLNGDGANKPLGVFYASALGINTDRDISEGNTETAVTVDGLKNAVGHLKAQYRANAAWIMHRDLETKIAKLKDGEGRYLFEPAITKNNPNMLLGFPIYLSEYSPNTFTTGQYVAILGDFSFYYIVDALDMQITRLNELYAETNQTGFICRAETDGMPVLSTGFVRVKLA